MQSLKSRSHSLGFIGSDANPKQMYPLAACCRIGEYTGSSVPTSEDSTAGWNAGAEGPETSRPQCDLEGLITAMERPAMATVGKRSKGRIDEWDQCLGHIVF